MGKGAYGTVKLVKSKHENQCGVGKGGQYALKTIHRGFKTQTDSLRLLRELRILRKMVDSQLIVDLVDIVPPDDPKTFKTMYVWCPIFLIFTSEAIVTTTTTTKTK